MALVAGAGPDEAFWLEEVETGGATTRYGPVRARAAAAANTLWLPLVRR